MQDYYVSALRKRALRRGYTDIHITFDKTSDPKFPFYKISAIEPLTLQRIEGRRALFTFPSVFVVKKNRKH